MVDNLPAVLGVIQATKCKIEKNLYWEKVYESQLQELIDKGYTKEVSDKDISVLTKLTGRRVLYICVECYKSLPVCLSAYYNIHLSKVSY